MSRIYVVGTADTKGEELTYLADCVAASGGQPLIVDVGTRPPAMAVDIGANEVAVHGTSGADEIFSTEDRGRAMSLMGDAFARFIVTRDGIAGVIGIGGGGGTSIITAGLRALPLGVPKIMVSTLVSGDIGPYVGVSDITMMPSVTDLAGLNRLSRIILGNAAGAVTGMACTPPVASGADKTTSDKPSLGLTMFGVTTQAVTAITEKLRGDYDCLVFHATGTGGRAMEKLAGSGMLDGVIDITTTEICDLLFGGALPASEDRLDVFARTGMPYIGSVGAVDMVNFLGLATVPEAFRDRNLFVHNPHATLMRTSIEECREIGTWIAAKLNAMNGPVRFFLPEKGVSALDIEGGAFFDPDADAALFDAIGTGVEWTDTRQLQRLPCHINDLMFAEAVIAAWREIAG